MAGETGVLTAEAPFMFTTTSGTTGEPKFIPVTTGWARAMATLMRLWTSYALRDHPGMLDARVLTIVGPATEGVAPGGLPYGAMTGLTYQRLPWLVRRQHALPYAAALIRDHESRYFVTLRLALGHSISSIATPNPSTLLRLAAIVAGRGDELLRAIHDGTLGAAQLEPIAGAGVTGRDVRAALVATLRPDPRRAAFIDAVARRRDGLVLGDCWPELVLVACWLGGSAGIQARHLDAHFGQQVARRDLGLVASEGRFTIPVDDDSAAGVLALHTSFYEFIAEKDIDEPTPRALRRSVRSGSCRGQRRVRVQACLRAAGAAAALRHAGGLGRTALPGGIRTRPARDPAQVVRHAPGVGRGEPERSARAR